MPYKEVYGPMGAGTLEEEEKGMVGEHPRPTLTQPTTSYDISYI